mmetsp:Transcript_60778/g.169586  ORF Transcript_60778/g.169586 Transcript_60778/m.169586 type:complete len:210 (+) Transcript_60778:181-810(+)
MCSGSAAGRPKIAATALKYWTMVPLFARSSSSTSSRSSEPMLTTTSDCDCDLQLIVDWLNDAARSFIGSTNDSTLASEALDSVPDRRSLIFPFAERVRILTSDASSSAPSELRTTSPLDCSCMLNRQCCLKHLPTRRSEFRCTIPSRAAKTSTNISAMSSTSSSASLITSHFAVGPPSSGPRRPCSRRSAFTRGLSGLIMSSLSWWRRW